ncbi:hypothetical protein PS907_00600 [Pseudomonas fluorescens]|nr:hypothetical protein PS907_00600 [Pseudomonas fluorescens]
MHKDYAKKGSRFKKILVWVFGTCAAVPLTKFVESYYDVSIFSPAITGGWSWMVSIGSWFASDVSFPIWLVFLLGLLMTLLVVPVLKRGYVRYFKDAESEAPLSENDLIALAAVGDGIQESYQFGIDDVMKHANLSRIPAQIAIDSLFKNGLIQEGRDHMGFVYIDLTPDGRQMYVKMATLIKNHQSGLSNTK